MKFEFIEKMQNTIQPSIDKNINSKELLNKNISREEIELAEKLNAVLEFTIDRFEGNIAVLENRKTREMISIEKNKLPKKSKEGSILKGINNKYILDEKKTKEVEDRIKKKMNDLWN